MSHRAEPPFKGGSCLWGLLRARPGNRVKGPGGTRRCKHAMGAFLPFGRVTQSPQWASGKAGSARRHRGAAGCSRCVYAGERAVPAAMRRLQRFAFAPPCPLRARRPSAWCLHGRHAPMRRSVGSLRSRCAVQTAFAAWAGVPCHGGQQVCRVDYSASGVRIGVANTGRAAFVGNHGRRGPFFCIGLRSSFKERK